MHRLLSHCSQTLATSTFFAEECYENNYHLLVRVILQMLLPVKAIWCHIPPGKGYPAYANASEGNLMPHSARFPSLGSWKHWSKLFEWKVTSKANHISCASDVSSPAQMHLVLCCCRNIWTCSSQGYLQYPPTTSLFTLRVWVQNDWGPFADCDIGLPTKGPP